MKDTKTMYNKSIYIVLIIVIIGLAGVAFNSQRQLSDLKNNFQIMVQEEAELKLSELQKTPQQADQLAAQEEAKELVAKVSELIFLPEDELPTIATVSDIESLEDQPFFDRAKNGYKVLIYTSARKAILYDPVENKIVEVAPLNIGNTAAPAPAPTP